MYKLNTEMMIWESYTKQWLSNEWFRVERMQPRQPNDHKRFEIMERLVEDTEDVFHLIWNSFINFSIDWSTPAVCSLSQFPFIITLLSLGKQVPAATGFIVCLLLRKYLHIGFIENPNVIFWLTFMWEENRKWNSWQESSLAKLAFHCYCDFI